VVSPNLRLKCGEQAFYDEGQSSGVRCTQDSQRSLTFLIVPDIAQRDLVVLYMSFQAYARTPNNSQKTDVYHQPSSGQRKKPIAKDTNTSKQQVQGAFRTPSMYLHPYMLPLTTWDILWAPIPRLAILHNDRNYAMGPGSRDAAGRYRDLTILPFIGSGTTCVEALGWETTEKPSLNAGVDILIHQFLFNWHFIAQNFWKHNVEPRQKFCTEWYYG
jgi:hypothetical protein